MANNECSGPALLSEIIKYVKKFKNRKYTYRFIFVPETIGSLTYLSRNNNLKVMQNNVIAGFNLTCVGDNRDYSMVHTRYANTLADRALLEILKSVKSYSEYSFLQRGSDERQYNAPGIDLPVVTFCRSKFHVYPEYHTSKDNMKLVSEEGFQGSFDVMKKLIDLLELNEKYIVTVLGEPQLGRRGLYPTISQKGNTVQVKKMMDFLAYADGGNDLFDISNITGISVLELVSIVDKMKSEGLVRTDNTK